MVRFLQLSFKNLLKAVAICFLAFFIFLVIIAIVIAVTKNPNNEEIEIIEIALFLIAFSAGLSILIMAIAFFYEYHEYNLQRTIFQRPPFSQLNEIGFKPLQLLRKSSWTLYKEVYHSCVNGFHVIANKYTNKKIAFSLLVQQGLHEKVNLPEQYRETEAFMNDAALILTVPVDSYWTPSIQTIKELLDLLSQDLIAQGYAPAHDFTRYEKKMKWDMIMQGVKGGLGG